MIMNVVQVESNCSLVVSEVTRYAGRMIISVVSFHIWIIALNINMPSIEGFWDTGPHEPLPVEETWDEFVRSVGGLRISELLSKSPSFDNADYLFPPLGIVAELKEVVTEFGNSSAFRVGFSNLMARLMTEEPDWRPALLGGNGRYPQWFNAEFIRLFRPPISRVLKKANRQIRETKEHFGGANLSGVLLFVNDGFTGLGPDVVQALACSLLMHSYSSIDCFVYITLNRYVEIKGSNVPRLMWAPVYGDNAVDSLQSSINELGRKWFKFLESKIGPFTIDNWESEDRQVIEGSKAIILPGERLR